MKKAGDTLKNMKIVNKVLFASAVAFAVMSLVALTPLSSTAQDPATPFDTESIPKTGTSPKSFVPKGWVIEEDVNGDINADGISDHLLKLIEDKPKKEDEIVDRNRVLVLIVADSAGNLRNAAVTDKLLQCTGCGGAFYGVVDAPAEVTIEKGVIVISQDHGSRWVSEISFRFRYDEQPQMFILIGFDYSTRDRAQGSYVSESINYLTGKRIATNAKGRKVTTTVAKKRLSIEEVDSEEFETAAAKRLGVD